MKKKLRLRKGVYVAIIYMIVIAATLVTTERFERLDKVDFRNTNQSIRVK